MTNEELKKIIKHLVDKIQDRGKLVKLLTVIKSL